MEMAANYDVAIVIRILDIYRQNAIINIDI